MLRTDERIKTSAVAAKRGGLLRRRLIAGGEGGLIVASACVRKLGGAASEPCVNLNELKADSGDG